MSLLDIALPRFTEDAACRDEPPELFFPHEGGGHFGKAMSICKACPVQTECLIYALTYEEAHPGSRWGIYGGTTPHERRTIAAQNRKATA